MQERGTGYPEVATLNAYATVEDLRNACDRLGLLNTRRIDPDCPSFSVADTFFTGVVEGLKSLRGRIKLEILQGDLVHELSKMRLGGDTSRPAEFPRKYMRMWLSNVPYVLDNDSSMPIR